MKEIFLFSLSLLIISPNIIGQSTIQGYIIAIEGEQIYVDLRAPAVSIGNILSVLKNGEYMIHPVTKRKIKKEEELLAQMRIQEIQDGYSVATAIPKDAISKLKPGMKVQLLEVKNQVSDQITEISSLPQKSKASLDANDIISRYLKATGLGKLSAKDLSQTYLMKIRQTLNDGRKKATNSEVTTIASPDTKQIYSLSFGEKTKLAIIIDNTIGWAKIKFKNKLLPSRTVTIKTKEVNQILANIN